jgi:endonuclease/exonuclease/phosphatase family metal-dependent hydrolase
MTQLTVATFNLHAGVDGWGRPFNVVAAALALDADVLLLQETWTPNDGEGLAGLVAAAGGYEVHEARISDALLFDPPPRASRRWGPYRADNGARALWVSDAETLSRVRAQRPDVAFRLGGLGIAVLSRLAVSRVESIELGSLSRDGPGRRDALLAEIEVGGSAISVVGTHLAHFMHGSPILLERLRRRLPPRDEAGLLAGDMNFWGPPVALALPGWRRAVRARTYPSWRAHSQIDHILVTEAIGVVSGGSVHVGGSDHLPLRARLAIG